MRDPRTAVRLLLLLSVLLLPEAAWSSSPLRDARAQPWRCQSDRPARWAPEGVRGDDTLTGADKLGRVLLHQSDLANGVLYAGAFIGLELGAEPPDDPRWTASAGFEDDVRDDLVASSRSGRSSAATASDVLLGLTATAPLWLDIGLGSWRKGDCTAAVEMFGEAAEALFLTLALTETAKLIAGRERPFQRECGRDSDYSDDCFEKESRKSFFSGHASLAAAGAGILCRNTVLRGEPVWGNLGSIRNPLPCALGVSAAVATGLLRVGADKHWLGDVLAGWAVGFTLGLFDLPGPFDLLSFKYETAGGEITGAVVPSVGAGTAGARFVLRF